MSNNTNFTRNLQVITHFLETEFFVFQLKFLSLQTSKIRNFDLTKAVIYDGFT